MSDSNTFRELLRLLPGVVAFPFLCFGIELDNPLTTRIRDRWGAESGFPSGAVYAISQGKDGYLWIGTEQGLVRFDGQHFRLIENSDPAQPVRPVIGLTPLTNGDLWVRPRRPSLLRFRRGGFDNPVARFGRPGTTVAAATHTPDGSLLVWMLKGEPSAAVLRQERFETVSAPLNFSRSPVLALAQLRNGEIWVGTRDAGVFRLRGNESTPVVRGLPDSKVNCLLPTSRGDIWIGTDNGLVRWNGRELTSAGIPASLRRGRILALAGDRDSNLWVGTNSIGLIRLDAGGQHSVEDDVPLADAVTALFEDREGSIWIGRANRLERIRKAPFVTLEPTKGIPFGPIHVDGMGGVWTAPLGRGLMYIKGGTSRRISTAALDKDVVHSLAGANNELWIGRQSGAVTHVQLEGGTVRRAVTYDRLHGLPGNTVSAVHRSANGDVWAGTIGGGVVKVDSKGIAAYTTAVGLASNVITSIADTPDGWTWFGTPRGLSGLSREGWRTLSSSDELPSRNISCLFTDSTGTLWVGTVAGLAVRRAGRVESLASLFADTILGIAEDRVGWLWISTSTRVLRIDRKRLAAGSATKEDFWTYGRSDGLVVTEGIRRQRSIVADDSGRILLASRHGVSMSDLGRGADAAAPAIVDIHTVSADGEPLGTGSTVRVPPPHRRIRIGYAGLNLSSPGRVRFRYRMDPFDTDWSESVAFREAVYTNLSPGEYKFRVMASGPNGEWNGEEAVIPIAVEPAFWQTLSFRASAAFVGGAGIVLLYRRRFQQLTRQMNVRFEERLVERTRIAQELHDTLLQGFLSASMQLHVLADRLDQSDIKPQVDRVLNLIGQVIDEGRNAVRGLRSSRSESLDLEEAFSMVRDEITDDRVDFRVVAVGTRRPLHPILRDEVYRIGREALLNAIRHSGATRIDATVEYTARRLRISVRDNGSGIDSTVLKNGREGHWGLSGMKERTEAIGGKLHVWSGATGTEIQLNVPSDLAFLEAQRGRTSKWFRRPSLSQWFHNGRRT